MSEIQRLLNEVKTGYANPLDVMGHLRTLAAEVKSAIDEVEPLAFIEADKYPEKTFKEFGYEITKKDGSKRFNFKHIEEWQQADQAKKDVEAKYKQAYESVQKGLLAVTDDGEELDLPKLVPTKPSLSFKKVQE